MLASAELANDETLLGADGAFGSTPVCYGRSLVAGELTATVAGEKARGLKMRVAGMELDCAAHGVTGSRFVELVQATHDGRFVR